MKKQGFRRTVITATAVVVLGLVLLGATGCSAITNRLAGAYLASQEKRQVEQQWSDEHLGLKRPLDFAPFAAALDGFSAGRAAELDAMLATATILDMQKMMESGALTSEELTLYYIDRIRRYDANYNTILELNPDALEIARALDAERAAGSIRGPLHGMPILLKDNIATGDKMHTTSGAAALVDAIAPRDSFVVARLREAGAVILGKNNLSEWANMMSSGSTNGFTALGGPTRNAYGRYDVLGSSSGTASSMALRFAAAAVGSETIGSIVAPSSNNSVAGFRPTMGLASDDLIIPISDQFDSAGPIGRTVTDLAVLLGPLSALDENNPFAGRAEGLHGQDFLGSLDKTALQGKRIGLVTMGTENKDEMAVLAASLRKAGAEVVEVKVGARDLSGINPVPVLVYGLREGVNAYLAATNAPISSLEQIIAFNKADLEARAPYGQDYLEQGQASTMTQADYLTKSEEMRAKANSVIDNLLQKNKLDALAGNGNAVSSLYAIGGAPGLTVPAGYNANGRPFGVTLFARPGSDATILSFAYAFEQANQARVEPTIIQP